MKWSAMPSLLAVMSVLLFLSQHKCEATGRKLTQTKCSFQYQNEQRIFRACQDLSSDIGTSYNLLWTIDSAQNGASLMTGAMDVQQDGWAAFGFPQSAGSGMLGGSALLVKRNASSPSGASISDVYLGGFNVAAIKPPSYLSIVSMNATLSAGRLQALFQIRLNGSANALANAPTPYIYAVGMLDPSGVIEQHADTQGIEDQIQLGPGLASGSTPDQAPAGQPTGIPAPAPAPEPSLAFQSPGDETCGVLVNGAPQAFSQCRQLISDTSAMRMGWSLASDAKGNGTLMTGMFQCTGGGWCGWGYPQAAGAMIGTSALIVKPCATCSSGASVDKYYLGGKSSTSVRAGQGVLDVQSMNAARAPDGKLLAVYNIRMLQDASALSADRPIIMAHGPTAGSALEAHDQSSYRTGTINLATGSLSVTGDANRKKLLAHGWLMGIALIIILPISAVIAATLRSTLPPRAWFQIHRALGILAFLAVVPGAALGNILWRQLGVNATSLLTAHGSIGNIILGFIFLQVLAVVFRPTPENKLRGIWNFYHHNVGRIVLLLGFANVVIGLYLGGQGWGWYLGIGLFWLAVWLVAGASFAYNRFRWSRKQTSADSLPRGAASMTSTDKHVM